MVMMETNPERKAAKCQKPDNDEQKPNVKTL